MARGLWGLACLWGVVCGVSCGKSAERYTTRGLVRAIDGAGVELRVAVQHERIEAFRDRDGQLAPMSSMTMIFGLADPRWAAQLALGKTIAFDFEVHWHERPTLVITRVAPLSVGEKLVLGSDHH